MRRVLHHELLDDENASPREVASALRSLRWVNRLFGGNRMHRHLLSRVATAAGKRDLHILEVACGHATALQSAALRLFPQIPGLRLTLLDRSAQHFPSVAQWKSGLPRPAHITADALGVPLPDNSVDVVSCCLFLHHLSVEEAHMFLRESLRLARCAVVINDLERTPLHHALAKLFSLVDPSQLSRHDGPVSVAQAFALAELGDLLRASGHRFELARGYLFRLGAILWK
jgi:hypothetical protein